MSDQLLTALIGAFAAIAAAVISAVVTKHRCRPDANAYGSAFQRYGLRITYPAQGSFADGEVEIGGTYSIEPPAESLFLVNASLNGPPYWPCVGRPIEISSSKKTWRGSTYIDTDSRVKLVSVGSSARALFNYFEKVGKVSQDRRYIGIDCMTADVKEHDSVLIRYKPR